ncbi:hypothetical protein BaRGS_00012866 [Batillaria attramentaria]|uniref:Uncharacterized protein n=1 Tax=Batillaria attramentaria TaxID=370345 RepID=A0ABD0L9C0_9CAEN
MTAWTDDEMRNSDRSARTTEGEPSEGYGSVGDAYKHLKGSSFQAAAWAHERENSTVDQWLLVGSQSCLAVLASQQNQRVRLYVT